MLADLPIDSAKQKPVVGVVVEPIQSEGGDYHGSPAFFQRLQKITKKVDSNRKRSEMNLEGVEFFFRMALHC